MVRVIVSERLIGSGQHVVVVVVRRQLLQPLLLLLLLILLLLLLLQLLLLLLPVLLMLLLQPLTTSLHSCDYTHPLWSDSDHMTRIIRSRDSDSEIALQPTTPF